ncbi:efflux RND transporter periplasmic adaptor subunit [Kushneria indalinina]|uniref:RND family efflux transporter MFP subunit n=1 Tax=Kushneria indalinina DSM 14324 TaxID=1122140 RepID=A0A3D9DUL7_9GAMM|nr:HlyD family secretion protein [Kushneria indalinina]REC94345.1 RND family efflux transporter MFP subunit [Kushneria indalinina DSM 14324]
MRTIIRVFITLVLAAIAIALGVWLWQYYMYTPWTRDARVRADIVTIAPDVSGWVMDLDAHDNQQVKAGDILFTVNHERYEAAVRQAEATLANREYSYQLSENEYERRRNLGSNAISSEDRQTAKLNAQIARAQRDLAQAQLDSARIDLDRSVVKAPVDGSVINLQLRRGNYVSQGNAQMSIVRDGSFYITAYFEETKIPSIDIHDEASIWLMGGDQQMQGHVVSIGRGIANTNTTPDGQLLPQVQQTFTWVRLSQRIPVDIAIDHIPDGVYLSSGMTASVRIDDQHRKDEGIDGVRPQGMGNAGEQARDPDIPPAATGDVERQDP